MPKLMNQDEMNTHQTLQNFTFSAVKIENLGASEYTIVTVAQDTSGSVTSFRTDMEACLQKILESCKLSPRSENLLMRLIEFNDDVNELHGFMELNNISPADYSGILKCYGATALRDATVNAAESTEAYGKSLSDMDYRCNGIMFVITDGDDNSSVIARSPAAVKKALDKIKRGEIALESFLSILIGVGDDPVYVQQMEQFAKDCGFDQFIALEDATPSKLAKLADFISRSISSSSTALANGQPSQPLTF